VSNSVKLSVEIDASELEATFAAVADALNTDDVLDEAATIILNNTRARYLQELNPDGIPWIPSQAGMDRRRAGGTGTLFATGTLWRSIQLGVAANENERVIIANAETSKGYQYGLAHQYGTEHLPIREFMGVPESDIELFEGRMLQRVANALGLG